MKELLDLVRARPGSVTFATMGNTSFNSLLIGWLKNKRATEFYSVPYKNVSQAMTATVSGEVQASAYAVGQAVPMVKAGKLKALAVASSRRSALLPDVPTLAEAGVDMVIPRNWVGLFAPAGTPGAVIMRLNTEASKALSGPGFKEKLMMARGIEPDENTGQPAQVFEQYLQEDRKNYADIVAAIGIPKR
jgi:tripartite-type tricarboxylate transporter receptor subunit TctC